MTASKGASANIGLMALVTILGLAVVLLPGQTSSQRPEPEVHGVFDGDTMYTVLPPNAIPAIMEPEFLEGDEARAQMSPDEMLMGILVGGEARAYSLWHLDAHEIVNDSIAGLPIAATW